MRWNRDRRSDRADRLIRGYFDRQIARVDVRQPPRRLRAATAPRAAQTRERRGLTARRRFPDLVCALALAAGFAAVVLHVGRSAPLAGLIESQAVRYQWTTILPKALDSAQKTISLSFNGG